MIADIWTMIWKECKEFIHQRGSARGTALMLLIPAFVLGIFFPLQAGRQCVESLVSLIPMSFVPLILVVAMIADSFAGERERHTLETLLASRLSDKAILLGKMFASMGYALALTVLILVLGLVTVNLAHWDGEILLFPVKYVLIGALTCILTAFLASSAGVLVSLKASTVRQAHQTLSFGVIVMAFLPSIAIQFLPTGMKKSLFDALKAANITVLALIVFGTLFAVGIILLWVAMARFKRSQLILD